MARAAPRMSCVCLIDDRTALQTPGSIKKKHPGVVAADPVILFPRQFPSGLSLSPLDRQVRETSRVSATTVVGRCSSGPPLATVSRFSGKHTQRRRRRRTGATVTDVRFVSTEKIHPDTAGVQSQQVCCIDHMLQQKVTVTESVKHCAMVGA